MNEQRRTIAVLLALLIVAACGGNTPATPTETFGLLGKVTDSVTGAGIDKAVVTVGDGVNAGKSATTNGYGDYAIYGLQPGTFAVNVTAAGYTGATTRVTMTGHTPISFPLQYIGIRATFGKGKYRVGIDINPGRYFTDPAPDCAFWRLTGQEGPWRTIASADVRYDVDQWIVEIAASDATFQTDGHCTWSRSTPYGAQSAIRPGLWMVGSQVTPGTYRTEANYGCEWRRVRNFSGEVASFIQWGFGEPGIKVVEIRRTDAGFSSTAQCGIWTRVR